MTVLGVKFDVVALLRLAGVALLTLVLIPVAAAQQRFEGELPDGAGFFAIDLPDGWQPGGRLVVYNHGFTMSTPVQAGIPDTAPNAAFREYLLARGYALAAGSYGSRGWALFSLDRDQRALLARFREHAGDPGEILLLGGSLGGLVSVRTAESFAADGVAVAGVYALCPPLAGARTWDAAVDTRLLFDAVCPDNQLPAGSEGLPWVLDHSDIPESLGSIDDPETLRPILSVANRIRQCLGYFQPAALDTEAQLARRARLKSLLGIDSDDFMKVNLAYAIYPLADLIQAPEKLGGNNAFDNRFVEYGDPQVDADVLRVERDPLAAVRLRGHSDLNGAIGQAKLLVVHTTRDELVIPEHLEVLDGLGLPPAQWTRALVAEDEPGHCAFSGAEILTGFEALRRWIDGGQRPDAASLRSSCEAAVAASGSQERCAFDPEAELPPLDVRVRPRAVERHVVSPYETGAWFDPVYDGEGAFIEVLGDGRAVVSWYSYPPADESGEQTWLFGVGRVTGDGIHVAEVRQFSGAVFGADAFDPDDVEGRIWGEMSFWFDGCGQDDLVHPGALGVGRLRYSGPSGYGEGERTLYQLTHHANFPGYCTSVEPMPTAHPLSAFGGSWFRGPQAPGEGWIVQVDSDGLALLIWYTYDPAGRPAWMIGSAEAQPPGTPWVFDMLRPRGTRWGDEFDRDEVQRPTWGELRLEFQDCQHARATWTATEPGWSDGTLDLQRLTVPADSAPCTVAVAD